MNKARSKPSEKTSWSKMTINKVKLQSKGKKKKKKKGHGVLKACAKPKKMEGMFLSTKGRGQHCKENLTLFKLHKA